VERTATMVQGEVIRDLAFPCRQNRCLTQTLHFIDKADAVAPAGPRPGADTGSGTGQPAGGASRPAPGGWNPAPKEPALPVEAVEEADAGVTTIGPTVHVRPPGERAGSGTPPQGERERLIWAMEQCGWVQAKAARLLRVTPRQLGYALLKHRIEVRKF
jgi:Transcriptional regulator containing GAF, AAA-type ATPase, and DNA binding domains